MEYIYEKWRVKFTLKKEDPKQGSRGWCFFTELFYPPLYEKRSFCKKCTLLNHFPFLFLSSDCFLKINIYICFIYALRMLRLIQHFFFSFSIFQYRNREKRAYLTFFEAHYVHSFFYISYLSGIWHLRYDLLTIILICDTHSYRQWASPSILFADYFTLTITETHHHVSVISAFMNLLLVSWFSSSGIDSFPPSVRVHQLRELPHRQLVLGEDKHNSDAPLCWLSRWHTLLHLNFLNHSFSVKWTTFAFISLVKLPSDIVQHSPLSRTMTEFFAFPQKSQMNHWFNGRNSWHAQLSYKNSNMTHHFKRLEGSSDEVLVAIS